MNKITFFLAAMAAEEFRRRAWVISAFSLIKEGPEDWRKNPYPYRIVQTPTGHFFVDPENNNELSPIDDTAGSEPPFHFKDRILIKAGQIPNVSKDTETNYGNLLFNFVGVIYPFGNKIPYQEGRVSASKIENLILERLQDDPKEGEGQVKSLTREMPIYVREYLKFCDAMFYLAGFSQLCVPASTKKTMTAAPGIVELKKKLLAENADRLHDATVIAKIQAQLIAYDREYLKGDPGENFLINKKSFEVVRSKLFGMHGAETGLEEKVDATLIENSLSQGWDLTKFPAMNESLRASSFNRGAQTQLGGESVKWLLRASSNIVVAQKDCGTRLGNEWEVDGENHERLRGFYVIQGKDDLLVTKENSQSFVGKKVTVRSPMFCKLDKTDYCEHCVGERLAQNPTGLSSAISMYGSAFLLLYLKAAHGRQLTLAKMDYRKALQ